jgi:hypothetical protein
MKVYISGYRDHWLSPYTVLEKVLFWKDWDNIEYETPWVERWSDRLLPICTALQKVLDFIHPKVNYVKIDRYDTWSMDHTLAHIILPMLKQLKAKKHGSPLVDDEDVPDELKSTSAQPKENEYDIDSNHHARWDYVMNEMIFAFEKTLQDNWDEEFWSGEHGKIEWEDIGETHFNEFTNKEEKLYKMITTGTRTCDWDARQKVADRITNGFRLFGKYYQGLWD